MRAAGTRDIEADRDSRESRARPAAAVVRALEPFAKGRAVELDPTRARRLALATSNSECEVTARDLRLEIATDGATRSVALVQETLAIASTRLTDE